MMWTKRLLLVLTLFAAALTVQANDTPLLIEFNSRDGALSAGVSASGTVVGNLATGGAFYWMPTTGTIFIGGYQGMDVSLDGRTIVGIARDTRGIQQAGIWVRAAEWQLLGAPRPDAVPCLDFLSGAAGTSDDGRVIVGWANVATSESNACASANSHAFRWEASTGMTDLGSSVPGQSSQAKGVSGDGRVVVGSQRSSTGLPQGARWVDGRQELIPAATALPGGFVGTAHAANRDGSVVVGETCRLLATSYLDFQAAWIWTASGGTQCLPAPMAIVPEGPNSPPVVVRALATSLDGHVVVGEQGIGATDTEAVIWIDRTAYYLKDYLRANGVPDAFQRWIKTGSLSDVTPDGRILVGNGSPIGGPNGYIVILGGQP